ncbi:MAG: D-2-hydroxyacid dehydrogenase [Candidatus Hydrogenedentes bacterium]|nr:D-2-hydroxyacid dehydrogenase [Candidatus Hydrogenedentota bacterium]
MAVAFFAHAADPVRVLAPEHIAKDLSDIVGQYPNLQLITYASTGEMANRIPECDGVIGEPDESMMKSAGKLRWIQARYAGMEGMVWLKPWQERGLVLTNAKIIMGPQLADHAFALLLSLTRNMRFYTNAMETGAFDRSSGLKLLDLRDKTMLIIGLGGAGAQIADRAKAFGMRVIALDVKDIPMMQSVDQVGRPDELLSFLPGADVVMCAVPLTGATKHMLGAKEIAAMKPGAFIVNISRGGVIDTDALTQALESGHLGGAGLDVTEPEPLPANHPLWKLPNVIITPHMAGTSDGREPRTLTLIRDNIGRFAQGLPLKNVVDLEAGY